MKYLYHIVIFINNTLERNVTMEKKNLCLKLALGTGCISFLVLLNTTLHNVAYLQMDAALQQNIKTAISTNSTIDFSQVTNFDWDTLYVFTPYSSPTEIFDADNILTFNPKFNIEMSDHIIMLGFVKDHHLVSYVELPLSLVTNLPTTSMRFSKNTAVFTIHHDKEHPSINAITF